MSRSLRAQPFGDFQAIHAMHPSKMFGDTARFVGLHWADEVPFQFQRCQLAYLIQRFLQVVFPEVTLPGGS